MDCRTIAAAALAFSLCGCVLTQPETPSTVADPKGPPTKATSAKLALAFANIREKQSQESDRSAETQVKLRAEARNSYQEVLNLDPGNLDAQLGLARLHAHAGNFELAMAVYSKAMPRHAKSPVLWYEKGQCHNRQKDFAEAARCLHKALEIEPENRAVLTTLGLTLARMGREEESLTYLSRASSSALAHYNLARMQLHLGQRDQARSHLNTALRENPNLANARDLLAQLDAPPPNAMPSQPVEAAAAPRPIAPAVAAEARP
jgi:tetratricopeptide (TPR) repeat protein